MAFQADFSALDRLVHRLAFCSPSVQLTAADIEKSVLSRAYASVEAAQPIFITSLPRAGTTLMLEVFHHFRPLATHTYRDMPFVLAPLLWARISRPFRKRTEPRERAHGDGMQVAYDSPEAFEEILWRTFWPEKYGKARIELWRQSDGKEEARVFFAEHMKKIIALRRPDNGRDGRYVSKNNGNIARLDLIGHMFPDAKILLPVRHPIAQARSLFRQHCKFVEMHKTEPFTRRYMSDLGHYEFGDLHRPIAFPSLDALIGGRSPQTADYWLSYWIAAFDHVLTRRDKVILMSYEDTCAGGGRAIAKICERLEIAVESVPDVAVALLRPPPATQDDEAEFDPELRERAEELYRALASTFT